MSFGVAITYHYVQSREWDPRGTRPLWRDEFEAQLDWLEEHFAIVTPTEFLAGLEAGWTDPRPAALLTFDDGTRDHAEVVAPLLEARGLRGVFFVIAGATLDGVLPVTHAVHWLLGEDEAELWRECEEWAHAAGGVDLGAAEDAARVYHYEDSTLRGRVKFALNRALGPHHTEALVAELLRRRGADPAALAAEWFFDRDALRRLAAAGHAIGGHGVTHRSTQQLGAAGTLAEIDASLDRLTEASGAPIEWYTLPFGGNETPPAVAAQIDAHYQQRGIRGVPTTTHGVIEPGSSSLALPRVDTALLPPRHPAPDVVARAISRTASEEAQ